MFRRNLPPLVTAMLLLVSIASSQDQQSPIKPISSQPELTTAAPFTNPGPPPAGASASALEITGDELRAHNLIPDALDYYNAAIKRGADAVLLRNKMGIAYLNSTQLDRARKEFEFCIKQRPDYADGYNNLGATWYAKSIPRNPKHSINERDLKKSIQFYEKAIELRDDSASYHSNLGTAYFARKEYDKASSEYQRAMQIDPEVFERRNKTGIQALVMTQSDRAKFNYYLARLYAAQNNFELALKCLRKAMEDGYTKIDDVYTDVNFASLRKDPRFTELMNQKPAAIPQ